MRFAYLCSDPGVPVFGTKGASIHLREIVGALRRQGHTVKVFAANVGDEGAASQDEARQLPLEGFASACAKLFAEDLPETSQHLVTEWKRLFYSESVQKALLPALAAFRPDALYERYSLFNYAGVEVARELGIPLILEVNAPLALEGANHRGLILKQTALEMERRILGAADAVLVVSSALASHARDLGAPAERITVLPNGVDTARFDPVLSGTDVRREHDLDGKRVVGFVGTRRPWHDLDTVLAAVRRLSQRDPDIRLFLVGEAFEQEKAAASDLVRTAHVDARDVPNHLAAMDVIVVPYSREADTYFSPLKLYEAMAMAKPIVGAAMGQVAEVIGDGRNGRLYEPGNVNQLAETIAELLANPQSSADLGAAARNEVLASYTWDEKAGQIAAIARSCRVPLDSRTDSVA